MKIEVLGPGCIKCEKLYGIIERTLKELGKEAELSKVKDINSITQYGVLMTPALVIDGEVISVGKVLTVEEIKKTLEEKM